MRVFDMKRLLALLLPLALLLAFMLPAANAFADDGDYYGEDYPSFTMYKSTSIINPGKASKVTVTFNNITNYTGFYAYALLTVNEDNTKVFGDDGGNYMSREIGELKRNGNSSVTFDFTPSADLKSGSYAMTVTLVYKNRQGTVFTKDYPLTVTVDSGTPVDFQISSSSVSNSSAANKAVYGQPFTLNVKLVNNGETVARDVNISLNNLSADKIFQSGSYDSPSYTDFKNNTAKDLTFHLMTAKDITSGYYPVELKVTYYENGDSKEKILTAYVNVEGAPEKDEEKDKDKDTDTKLSVPRVILANYALNPSTVNMGEPFSFTFTLKNTSSDRTIKNLQVSLTSSEGTVMPASGSNSFYVAEIKPGGTTTLSLQMTTKYDTEKTSYPLTMSLTYEDAKANEYTASENLTIPVFLPTKLSFQNESYPEYGTVGESAYLSLEYINKGKGTIYNLTATVEGNVETDIGSGTYIGNVASGNTDSLEVSVTPLEAGATDCKLVFTYEDAAGNELRTELPFTINAEEAMIDDEPGMDDPGMDEPIDESGTPGWTKILGGVVVLIAAATAITLIGKKRKAKKRAAEEALFADNNDLD